MLHHAPRGIVSFGAATRNGCSGFHAGGVGTAARW